MWVNLKSLIYLDFTEKILVTVIVRLTQNKLHCDLMQSLEFSQQTLRQTS